MIPAAGIPSSSRQVSSTMPMKKTTRTSLALSFALLLLPVAMAGAAPVDPREAHLADLVQLTERWRERRGLLVPRRPAARLPVHPSAVRLRPDLPHAGGRLRTKPSGSRPARGAPPAPTSRADGAADPLRLDPPRRRRLPAAARPLAGLRLAGRPRLRDLERPARRLRPGAADRQRRLRRRGDGLPERRLGDLHLDPRRRPRPLPHGPGRRQRPAPDPRSPATTAARSSRRTARRSSGAPPGRPPGEPARAGRLPAPARRGPGAAQPAGDLGGRTPTAATPARSRSSARPPSRPSFFPSGDAHPLLLEPRRSQGPRVRPLGGGCRRLRTWSGSPGRRGSTASPCSRPTARASPSPRTATRARPGRPTSSWRAGWTARRPCRGERGGERFLADVRWLADDAREGRGVGTRGLEEARGWLERRFRELGVEPAGQDGACFQRASTRRSPSRSGPGPRCRSTAGPWPAAELRARLLRASSADGRGGGAWPRATASPRPSWRRGRLQGARRRGQDRGRPPLHAKGTRGPGRRSAATATSATRP